MEKDMKRTAQSRGGETCQAVHIIPGNWSGFGLK